MSELTELSNVFTRIISVLEEIRDILAQTFGAVAQKANEAGGGGDDGLAFFSKRTKKMFKTMGKVIKGVVSSVLGPAALLTDLFSGMLEPFELITDPITLIGEIFGTVLYPILQPFSDQLYKLADFLSLIMTKIEPFFPIIEKVINILIELIINILLAKVEYIYNKIVIWFNFIMNLIGDIVALFKGEISFGEFMARLITGIRNLITALIQNLLDYIGGIWDLIVGALESFGDNLVQWFKDLPDIIIQGLKDGWDASGDWWEELWA